LQGRHILLWITDLTERIAAHNRGKGAKYTRSRLPVELVYYEKYDTKHEAMSREWHIKRMGREEKNDLVAMFAETTDTHEA
jgi:putative endonuclease